MTEEQKQALEALKEALQRATGAGLLDILQAYLLAPDSINDVCDSLERLDRRCFDSNGHL